MSWLFDSNKTNSEKLNPCSAEFLKIHISGVGGSLIVTVA